MSKEASYSWKNAFCTRIVCQNYGLFKALNDAFKCVLRGTSFLSGVQVSLLLLISARAQYKNQFSRPTANTIKLCSLVNYARKLSMMPATMSNLKMTLERIFCGGIKSWKKYHMVSPGYSFTQDSVLRCAYLFYRVDLYSTKSKTPPFSKNFGGVVTKKDRGNMIRKTKKNCFTHSPFHG